MNVMAVLGLATASFSLVVLVALMLAPCNERRTVLCLVMFGLVVSALKIWIFQQTPQWHDISPDAITYDLNAQAFAEHWRGNVADAKSHQLRGLLALHAAGAHDAQWMPGDKLAYASVVGSHEWLFTGYIALWYWVGASTKVLVIWSNALWAAFFPAAAFGIAQCLGARRSVSLFAGSLALVDPSAGVNASWLLKDTLAGFLAMAALWALMAQLREGGWSRLTIAILAFGGLGGVRFVGFIALVISTLLISGWLLFNEKKRFSYSFAIIGIVVSAWLINGLFAQIPQFSLNVGASNKFGSITSPVTTAFQGLVILRSNQGDSSTDESVLSWKNALTENPVYATVRSTARTLFAPYPWVAISPGLNWVSFSELYYPGVVLWIFCLPGVSAALVRGLKQNDPSFWLIALFLAAALAAYTIWFGEWSTRQRVFALPAFFSLAAIGWAYLVSPTKNGRRWER